MTLSYLYSIKKEHSEGWGGGVVSQGTKIEFLAALLLWHSVFE
jgi:hypothetical protein